MLQHSQQQRQHLGGDAQALDHERPVRSLHLVRVHPPTLQRTDMRGAPSPWSLQRDASLYGSELASANTTTTGVRQRPVQHGDTTGAQWQQPQEAQTIVQTLQRGP
jgi:hypothetical protein